MRLASALLAAAAVCTLAQPASAQQALPPLPQTPPETEPQPVRKVAPVEPSAPIDLDTPPPSPPPTPPVEKKSKRGKESDMGALAASIGLRGMAQQLSGTDHDGLIGGAGLGGWLFATLGTGGLSARLESRSQIGGSGGGLDGQYGGDLSFGPRLALSNHFALLARLGASGRILGNGRLLWWTINLPELDLGAQAAAGRFFFEATGLAGITLGGNYLAGDEGQRKIGTAPHVGARATLGLQPFVVTASWRHILEGQHAPETPLDSLDLGACIVFAKYAGVAACADGRVLSGTVRFPTGTFGDTTALYGGLSISIGAVLTGGAKDFEFRK